MSAGERASCTKTRAAGLGKSRAKVGHNSTLSTPNAREGKNNDYSLKITTKSSRRNGEIAAGRNNDYLSRDNEYLTKACGAVGERKERGC